MFIEFVPAITIPVQVNYPLSKTGQVTVILLSFMNKASESVVHFAVRMLFLLSLNFKQVLSFEKKSNFLRLLITSFCCYDDTRKLQIPKRPFLSSLVVEYCTNYPISKEKHQLRNHAMMMDQICQTFMMSLKSDEQKIFPLKDKVSS